MQGTITEEGRSPVFGVQQHTRYLALFKGDSEVTRRAVDLSPGRVNRIEF